jgi:hypothetical protein
MVAEHKVSLRSSPFLEKVLLSQITCLTKLVSMYGYGKQQGLHASVAAEAAGPEQFR